MKAVAAGADLDAHSEGGGFAFAGEGIVWDAQRCDVIIYNPQVGYGATEFGRPRVQLCTCPSCKLQAYKLDMHDGILL